MRNEKVSRVCVERVRNVYCDEELKDALYSALDRLKDDLIVPQRAVVLIKLNLCLLKGPETGATVDPRVARGLIEWLLSNYSIEKIYLAEADATHLGADMAFRVLGWYDHFKDMERVELFNLSKDETVAIPCQHLGELQMSKTMMEADLLVSLGKLKTHTQQKITCILKNQFGSIPYKYKIIYHPRLAEAICDAAAVRLPDLSVIDGLIAMEGNGPTNGIPKRTKLLMAANDPVAMDHFCAGLMGFKPLTVPHLKLAIETGLGNADYQVLGTALVPANLRFRFLPEWKRVIKTGIEFMKRGIMNGDA